MGRKRKNFELKAPKIVEEKIIEEVPPSSEKEIEEHDRLDREYFDTLPPGYRFNPTSEELIEHYLKKKVSNSLDMPLNRIRVANIYALNPEDLTRNYKLHREKEWYFFSSRTKKYPNGKRPDRSAGKGFWKATGADVDVADDEGIIIGTRKTLVYHRGKVKEKNATKTNWIMHEYRHKVNNPDSAAAPVVERLKTKANNMKLDDWVLCKIYCKKPKEQVPNPNPNGVGVDNATNSAPTPASSPMPSSSTLPSSSSLQASDTTQAGSHMPSISPTHANSPMPSSSPTPSSSPMPSSSPTPSSSPFHPSYPMQTSSLVHNHQVPPRHSPKQDIVRISPTNYGHLPNQNTNRAEFDNIAANFPRQDGAGQVAFQNQSGIGFGDSVSFGPIRNDHLPNLISDPGPDGACFQNRGRFPMPASSPRQEIFPWPASFPGQTIFPQNLQQVPNPNTNGTDFGYWLNTLSTDELTSMLNSIQSLPNGQSFPPSNLQAKGMWDIIIPDIDLENSLANDTHSQFAVQEPDEVFRYLNDFGLECNHGQLPSLDDTIQKASSS